MNECVYVRQNQGEAQFVHVCVCWGAHACVPLCGAIVIVVNREGETPRPQNPMDSANS